MNTAYLIIGGNMGDREKQMAKARKLLEANCGKITNISSLYKTAAWGNKDQPDFLNQAIVLQTKFNATELMNEILLLEKRMGRLRSEKYGPRIIDIDIIFFNHEVHYSPRLIVPHPAMQRRLFVLKPLSEVAADFIHPVLQKSVQQLLEECDDQLEVIKYS